MKNVSPAGTRNSVTKLSRACLVSIATLMLVACGGSGGGDDGFVAPLDPVDPPGQTYAVSGNITGLVGAVRVSDSFQSLDITSDGGFAFTHRYQKGDTFDVTVDTGTTDQLCTVTRGAGIVLADINDVSIDCLEVREANIRIVKPEHYTSFGELNLRSSYQLIPQLDGETATLVVAKNQFVTVATSDAQALPVYLAFVKSFDETVVDSLSTAVSLVLLNPSIHNAIEEREARFEFFANRLAALQAVAALSEAIKHKADAGQFNLQVPAAEVLTLLDAAVIAAAAEIAGSDTDAATLAASQRNLSARKLQVIPVNGTQDGVSVALQKITPDAAGNNYQLQISNSRQRYIALESTLLAAPIALPPEGSQSQPLQSATIDSVSLKLFGPGAQAATAPVSALLKQAVIDTAGKFYAAPSLAFTAGRLDAFDLRLLACIDAASLQQIRDEANNALLASTTLDSALLSPHYTAAYDAVATPLRASVIAHLDTLMQCEFFRKGHWLDEHAATAQAQIGTMLNIEQAFYAPRTAGANVLVTPGLLAAGSVINSSLTEQQWQLSNTLAIALTQTRNGSSFPVDGTVTINAGETLVLGASCTDPSSAATVACNVQWTSAQGTTAGDTFSQTLAGSATINVAATDEDGANASRMVAVTVVPLPPQSASFWTQQNGASSNRFDVNAVDVIADSSDNVTQIRGFSAAAAAYPQISISLPHFAGAGSYVLDDLSSGRACLGFVATAQPVDQWWCTKTADPFAAAPATGTAIYVVDSQGRQSVDFDFTVVPTQCAVPPCTQQRISGHIELP